VPAAGIEPAPPDYETGYYPYKTITYDYKNGHKITVNT